MELSFNELSLNDLMFTKQVEHFYKQLEEIVRLLNLDELPNVVFKSNFTSININGLGNIYEIVKSLGFTNDQEGALFGIIQNTPFVDDGQLPSCDVLFNQTQAYGLRYSIVHGNAAISIPHVNWSEFTINVVEQNICLETQQIISTDTQIKHIGDLNTYQGTWLEALIPIARFANPEEFITFCKHEYTRITLSDISLDYLQRLNLGRLLKLKRSFDILEEYCIEYWTFGGIKHSVINDLGLNARPESSTTMQKYGDQRKFKNEMDEVETFSIHFDVSESERAYFKGVKEDFSIYIAYIGNHLSTKKFPN
jgi:hypothetical protein